MEERLQVALAALGLRRLELLGHELVVDRALDVPEDPDRRRAVRGVRDPREREREARLLVVLVVDEQRVLTDVGHVDELARAVRSQLDAALALGAEADRLPCSRRIWFSVCSLTASKAPSL